MAPYVRSWHKADIRASAPQMSAFGGKADMVFALQMSAYDPKRTLWAVSRCLDWSETTHLGRVLINLRMHRVERPVVLQERR